MSSDTSLRSDRRGRTTASAGLLADAQPLQTRAGWPLRAAGFWAAVLLPFVALAFLFSGLAAANPIAFAVLVGANVAGIVLGRDHNCE
ncbi:MAG: hypothetical protein ABEI96_04920 [Haloarculaceae archaeon]